MSPVQGPIDPPARDALVREALDLVDLLAKHICRQLGGRVPLDDLRGHAHEAVIEVVDRFDPQRGVSFRTWARLRLRGAILDGLRRDDAVPRQLAGRLRSMAAADTFAEGTVEERAAAAATGSATVAHDRLTSFLRGLATACATGLVATEGDSDNPGMGEDPERLAAQRNQRAVLERAVASLGDPEATLVYRHYFLDEDLQDAAAHCGVSKSWASRLHARAMLRLAERLGQTAAAEL